jgi:dTDP-4-amino-4,6-dideoxygalactose transaminase
MIVNGKQNIDNSDIKSVISSLKQKLITSGPLVTRFEAKINEYTKAKYSLVCSSGTAALHLALESIDISEGDILIMPSINFIAVFNIATLMKAKIYLTDVDPLTGQMTPLSLLDCINKNKIKKIKAVITMYLGGAPENIDIFYKIKKKYKFYWIEDACHAFGASYLFKGKNYQVGSCKHADISAFSFHPLKTITTGEGGAVTTNNVKLYKIMKNFRSHNLVSRKRCHWKYYRKGFGLNYRLTDIQCALGISQINRIKKIVNNRTLIAKNYNKLLNNFSNYIQLPNYNFSNKSSWHLYPIFIDFSKLKVKKDFLFRYFFKKKILLQFHYTPIYLFKNLRYLGKFNKKNSMKYFNNALSLPIYYKMTIQKQLYVVNLIKLFLRKYRIKS